VQDREEPEDDRGEEKVESHAALSFDGEKHLYGRGPTGRVFASPARRRVGVVDEVAGVRIDAQLAAGLVGDRPDVREEAGLRAVLDGGVELRAGAHGVEEVLHVQHRQRIIPDDVRAIRRLRKGLLPNDFVFQVVEDIPITVDEDAAVGAEDDRAAFAVEESKTVAALTVLGDHLAAVRPKFIGDFLGIGKLPVILKVEALADG